VNKFRLFLKIKSSVNKFRQYFKSKKMDFFTFKIQREKEDI